MIETVEPYFIPLSPNVNRAALETGFIPEGTRIYASHLIAAGHTQNTTVMRVVHPGSLTRLTSLRADDPAAIPPGVLSIFSPTDQARIQRMIERDFKDSNKSPEKSLEILGSAILGEPLPVGKTGVCGSSMADTFPFFDSSLWPSKDDQARQFYHALVDQKILPSDFSDWTMSINYSTIAHCAAYRGVLPETFAAWGIRNADNRSVAHIAAEKKNLPNHFSAWDIVERDGWTVAHEAALSGRLPPDFAQWHLTDAQGVTVIDVARERHLHLVAQYEAWCDSKAVAKAINEAFEETSEERGDRPVRAFIPRKV